MEKVFKQKHEVSPEVVADMHQDVYKASGKIRLLLKSCIKFISLYIYIYIKWHTF